MDVSGRQQAEKGDLLLIKNPVESDIVE